MSEILAPKIRLGFLARALGVLAVFLHFACRFSRFPVVKQILCQKLNFHGISKQLNYP